MHATDAASRDGRGGVGREGRRAAGTVGAGAGAGWGHGRPGLRAAVGAAALAAPWLGSGREKGREGPYVRQGLAPITTALSSTPRSTAPRCLPSHRHVCAEPKT